MAHRIIILLLSLLLMVGEGNLYAQKKGSTTQKKPVATAQKKPTTTQKKPSTKQTTKPAGKTTKKPASKATTKPQSKSQSSPAPQKTLSRAEYEKQQKDLQKQIEATEKMIANNNESALSQSRDIKLREDEIGKRRALLVSMHKEIDAIRQEEDSLVRLINQLTRDYKGKQEKYAAAMQHLFKWRSGFDEWMFILSAEDMVTSLRRMRYLRQYSAWREKEAHELEQQRLATESVKQRLSLTRADREEVLGKLEQEREKLTQKQRVQEQALANLQKRNKELKKELAAAQKKQREIQNMIQNLIAEERKKAEAARKKAESASSSSGNKKSESSSTSASSINDTELAYSPSAVAQLTGSFRQNKGKMPYPVDSNFAFLSHYTHDGNYSITLSTTQGAHACAIFEGSVVRTERSSEDWTVIISHGEYMSVYSNLSSCHVKEGQKVKMRQSIGRVKDDVDGHRAELMFWIYGKNEAENPEAWLKR